MIVVNIKVECIILVECRVSKIISSFRRIY